MGHDRHVLGRGLLARAVEHAHRVADGAGDRAIVNPSTGDALAVLPDTAASATDAAVERAVRTASVWGRSTPSDRANALLGLAQLVDDNRDALGQLESLNTGKSVGMASDEVAMASDALRFFAGAARANTLPSSGRYTADHTSVLVREPIGVVAGIVPWNYPLLTAVWKIAPALAAGNVIVLKPSELTPLTMLALAALANLDGDAPFFEVVLGDARVGQQLAEHADIGLISLTGSVAAGQAVSAAAATSLKRVHLELGGKAPVIVFADADLDAAVASVAVMSTWNAGQECGAATRVFVEDAIHDDFVTRLSAAYAELTVGDPANGDFELGPIISAAHLERIEGLVSTAKQNGAIAHAGGGRAGRPGFFFTPTVLSDVAADSEIDRVEIFGPVVTTRRFNGDELGVVEAANRTRYALSASVWTRDGGRGLRVAHALDYGTVWINDHLALATEMPWGGYKNSGTGCDLSTLSLDEYSRTKHVMIRTS